MSVQIQNALALIETFATGDAEKAASLLAEGYIQHNLAYGTGRDAFVGSVQYLASAPAKTTVKNIRAYEDGDKVFLHTVYNFAGAGEQVAFDVFRFDSDGLIAEHWDNLASLAEEPNPSGHTQIDSVTEASDLDMTEVNRETVRNFLVDVMQNQHPEKTPEYFDGDAYLQHNESESESESESAPNPLTHRFPFRHDVGNGGNGGGYEHAIAQVHPRVQEARGRAVQVDGGRHLRPDRA